MITSELDLTKFSSGKPALDDWLRVHPLQAGNGGTASTFVVLNEDTEVVGYYSLSMGSISQDEATARVKKGTGRHSIPVILLARLAVDDLG